MDDMEGIEVISQTFSNREIDIPKEDRTRIRDLLDVNVVVDGSDVCVGHTISLVDGETLNYILSSSLTKKSPLKFLMEFVKTDLPGKPIPIELTHTREQLTEDLTHEDKYSGSIFVRNINGHSTRIHIVKTFTKTYIWYHNPWGFESDFSHINEAAEEIENNYIDEPGYDLLGTASDFYDYNLNIDDRQKEFLLYGKNLVLFHSINYEKYKKEMEEWESWMDITDAQFAGIPEFHIMSTLSLLKSVNHKNHIEIIHPYHSMLRHGPQSLYTCQGVGKLNRFINKNIEVGACIVWDELYTIHSNHLLNQSVLKNTVDIDLPIIVTQKLLVDPLLGEKDERRLLGKLMFLLSPDIRLKTVLSLMFSLIPKENEILDKNEYYSNLNSAFDWIKNSSEPDVEMDDDHLRRFLLLAINSNGRNKHINEIEEIMIRMSFIEIPSNNPTYVLDMIMILISCKHSEYFKEFKNEIVFPGSFTFDP